MIPINLISATEVMISDSIILLSVAFRDRATPWENLFMLYANNKDADQPAHPRSLISAYVVRCLDSMIPLLAIAEILRT